MSVTEKLALGKYPLGVVVDADITYLKNNPWNPRSLPKERIKSLAASISNDPEGLEDRPLIALPDGTVIAGNARLIAARDELKWSALKTVFRDYDATTARLVAIRDNTPWGAWEDEGLVQLLKELEDAEIDLELTGFTADEVTALFEAGMDEPPPEDRGTDLALADVSIGDPVHQVEKGEVWRVGPHLLVCAEVYDGWTEWVKYLDDPSVLLVPYPTPTLPLTVRAEANRLVMVQPDRWLAGHVLDKFAAVRGAESVEKMS